MRGRPARALVRRDGDGPTAIQNSCMVAAFDDFQLF
jgi:hypothetical protein